MNIYLWIQTVLKLQVSNLTPFIYALIPKIQRQLVQHYCYSSTNSINHYSEYCFFTAVTLNTIEQLVALFVASFKADGLCALYTQR